MIFERFESTGLAAYSYLVGDQGEALVIDPRRDCEVYLERTRAEGLCIRHILETHRHEDFVVGSLALAERCGAVVWHADASLDYRYGQAVKDGHTWQVGRLKISALHTPGHTPGSMSYLLHDPDGAPWVIFSGDTLFAGEVGRVDLVDPARTEEMAAYLYESVFEKLLPLGDGVIVCPAHGTGSVCGTAIAERIWTTIGLERKLNPHLQHASREDFIREVSKVLDRAPYFQRMERLNLEGAPLPSGRLPELPPLSVAEFKRLAQHAAILDVRSPTSFGAAHIPGSLSIVLERIPDFGGWFLDDRQPILLVGDQGELQPAIQHLVRLGYDNLAGYLGGGILSWHMAGRETQSVGMVTVHALCRRLDSDDGLFILDVRSNAEIKAQGEISGAIHIPLTALPVRQAAVPQNQPVYIFCGSGQRSMTAASLLVQEGWSNLYVVLGGVKGWRSTTCPLKLV